MPSYGDTIKALRSYRQTCEKWHRDISHVLEDLQFTANGNTIYYAVDFSEIFSYSDPDKSATTFKLFADELKENAVLFQRVALERLFFEFLPQPVLLWSYSIELHSYIRQLQKESTKELFVDYELLAQKRAALMHHPRYPDIDAIFRSLEQADRDPTEEELKICTSFLSENAASILTFFEHSNLGPTDRIRKLLQEDRLTDLKDMLSTAEMETLTGDRSKDEQRAIEEDIVKELIPLRQQRWRKQKDPQGSASAHIGASVLDAKAFAEIFAANKLLKPRKKKLVLVTRSSLMRKVCDKWWRSNRLPVEDFPLRHPRIFSVQYNPNYIKSSDIIGYLQKRKKAIADFLESIKQVRQSKSKSPSTNETFASSLIDTILEDLQKGWTASKQLATTLVAAEHINPDDQAWEASENVLRIFRTIRNQAAFRESIGRRIIELHSAMQREQQYLAPLLLTNGYSPKSIDIQKFTSPDKYVVHTSFQAMPHTIQFYEKETRSLLELIDPARRDTHNVEDILDFFHTTHSPQVDYEQLLATAYILGTMGKWAVAEIYCEHAIENAIATHEAHFLISIIKRKIRSSVPRHLEALEHLKEAIMLKRDFRDDDKYRDPRYELEKVTHMLLLHTYYPQDAKRLVVQGKISDQISVINKLDDLLKLDLDDERLKILMLNNRLFYHIENNLLDDIDVLRSNYEQLLVKTREWIPDEQRWPPFILDTLAFTTWQLDGANEATLEYFNIALNSEFLDSTERDRIKRHRIKLIHEIERSRQSDENQHEENT